MSVVAVSIWMSLPYKVRLVRRWHMYEKFVFLLRRADMRLIYQGEPAPLDSLQQKYILHIRTCYLPD